MKQFLICIIILLCLFAWVLRDKTDYGLPESNSYDEMIGDSWTW